MMKVIALKGDLTEQLISQLREALLDRTDIELRIDSPGGSKELKDEALSIMEKITDDEFTITGVVMGEASSSAFMMLQCCTIRKALPSATLMFHPLQVSVPQGVYVMGGETAADPYEPEYLAFLGELSARTNLPEDTLWRWGSDERIFTAEEALQHHFIDEIVRP
ncbi:MAG: ATP-dependent Clp protease proteolytic subunit [Candidatus Doudnabacteria bacterium]|nr:ATP-dependent Clp protease proteolytic subunit [Candidatus Doudnabacteria bacterium]